MCLLFKEAIVEYPAHFERHKVLLLRFRSDKQNYANVLVERLLVD